MSRTQGSLSTFGGVFTPSILTILGLILFLRIGFVVGQGGVLEALAILALATAVSVLTSLSLSATATTRRVRGFGIDALLEDLPIVALVAASQDVQLSEKEPAA